MGLTSGWQPGDTVVIRGVWKGTLWWACPQYVVQDTAELIALFWRAGTPVRRWSRRPTVQELAEAEPELVEAEWIETDVLSLVRPQAAHSIDIMWEAGQMDVRCWYVHLQEPFRRSTIGYDTMDQILDIVISPNRASFRWKDEDEFCEAQSIGLYSKDEAQAIRQEGETVIEQFRANFTPFCDGWDHWRPPAGWTIPQFPQGWQEVPITAKEDTRNHTKYPHKNRAGRVQVTTKDKKDR